MKPTPKVPKADFHQEVKPLGQSRAYRINKFGLYNYQVMCIDLDTGEEAKVGMANTYGVVASDLIDLMFKDINPEIK